jgi:uncharacterized OB-fold protein
MSEKRPNRTLGPGHDDFWAWCARDELRLPRCADCGGLSWPAGPCCEQCGGTNLAWERLSGRGTLVSWCRFERDYYNGTLPIPWPTILVALEEGPLFVSNPHGIAWDELALDLPVKVAFIACEDAHGAFRLPVFERL